MTRPKMLVFLSFWLLLGSAAASGADMFGADGYFSLLAGGSWTYATSALTTDDQGSQVMLSAVEEVTAGGGGLFHSRIDFSNGNTRTDDVSYAIQNGALYVAANHTVIVSHTDAGFPVTTTTTSDSTYSPPEIAFPSSLIPGSQESSQSQGTQTLVTAVQTPYYGDSSESSHAWSETVDILVSGQETVTVGAGTFSTVRLVHTFAVTDDAGTNTYTATGWYAQGVGLVKYDSPNHKRDLVAWEAARPDETGLGCPDGKCKGAGGDSAPGSGYGVPTWVVNTTNQNIYIQDTPLWYKSPVGPSMEFTVSYNSKSVTAHFEPVGRKWQLSFESYLVRDLATGEVTVYMPDGRRDVYTPNAAAGYDPPYHVYNHLVAVVEDRHYELVFPDDTVYTYKIPQDSFVSPLLVEIRDSHGNTLAMTWESSISMTGGTLFKARLVKITDALDRITTLTHDENDRITRVQDPFLRTATFDYDEAGNMIRITDMGGYATDFTYDAAGIVQEMVQGTSRWDFQHSAAGITVANNLGAESFSFAADGASYQAPDSSGAAYAYRHLAAPDGKHKEIAAFTTPEGVDFAFTYDENGNRTSDARQVTQNGVTETKTSQFTYNSKGKVTSVVDARGNRTQLTYASNGVDLLTLTDALGTVTAAYNDTHDIVSLTDRLGNTKTFSYNDRGQVTATSDSYGGTSAFQYDGLHRFVQLTRDGMVIGRYDYDDIGRVVRYTDASGTARTYLYNDLDDLLRIGYPDGRATVFTYSAAVPHLLESMTEEPGGRTTAFRYNALKQVTEVKNPEAGVVAYTYDVRGGLRQMKDPNGNATSFDYDADGRLVKKTFPDGTWIAWQYTDGMMTRFTNARGITTDYTYDGNGNLLTVRYSDGTPGVTVTYDAANRPITVTDAVGTQRCTYDANSRLIEVDGPWQDGTVAFAYDGHGNRTLIDVQGGTGISYRYDLFDRLAGVSSAGADWNYIYAADAVPLLQLARPDGVLTRYEYDASSRLAGMTHTAASGDTLARYRYTFNDRGLPAVEEFDGGPPLIFEEGTTLYAHNTLNQLVQAGGDAFAYDADGNMTSGITGDGRPFTAAYDAESRLTVLQFTGASGEVKRREYVYRGDGFLAVEKRYENGALTKETRYIRHGGLVLQERDGENAVVCEYIHGQALAGGVGALLALRRGGELYQYLCNLRGDVAAVLAPGGAVAASYAYDPFGVPLGKSGAFEQPVGYACKFFDEDVGLVYFGRRFYLPRLGRWLSRDPLAERAGMNLYGFVSANPIAFYDPLGASEEDFARLIENLDPAAKEAAWADYHQMKTKQAADANRGGFGETMSKYVGGAFKWIGEKFTETPEAAGKAVDAAVDKALDGNRYTKFGKDGYSKIKTAFEIAEDFAEVKRAWEDPDPASGLTIIKKGLKYTCGRVPVVGDTIEQIGTQGIEAVENSPGMQALRTRAATIDSKSRQQ